MPKKKPTTAEESLPTETEYVRASDFKMFYCNFIQTGFTFFDVAFALGENLGVQNGKFLVEQRARVSMSPMEAKIFYRILASTLRQYEEKFGAIEVPDAFMPPE